MLSTVRRPAVIAASCAAAIVVAVSSGYAVGASSSAKVVKACAAHKTGALRITTGKCKSGERSVSWSIAGPRGLRGPKGNTGGNGLSVGYSDVNGGVSLLDSAGAALGYVTIDSISLPAGSYLLHANVNAFTVGAANAVECALYTPAQQNVPKIPLAVGASIEFPAEASVVLAAPATVSYQCTADVSATTGDQLNIYDGSLQALAVNTLHTSSEL
jgi:hypothetical protein